MWRRGARRSLLKTRIFEVTSVDYSHPTRRKDRDFLVIDAADWGIVVPVTADGQLVMVRQFRFGIGALSWELPGGIIEPGEEPVAAVRRELAEETGYAGGEVHVLGSVHPNPAIFSNRCHVVAVTGVTRTVEVAWDADEEIEIATRPIDQVLAEARNGLLTHALMLSALFLFEPWWQGRAPPRV